MPLIRDVIYKNYSKNHSDYDANEKIYPINRVYIAKLTRFVSHLPRNMDKRNHVQEICEPYYVLVYNVTGNNYIDIETGETFTSDSESAVFYDKEYKTNKLYVSKKYIEGFKGRCYYTLRDKNLLNENYLTANQFRNVLDAELTWEDGDRRIY